MANHARADHVGDELVFLAIPCKQRRARAATAVELEERRRFVRRHVDLVLQHTGGPQHADDVGVVVLAQSGQNFRRPLAKIACATHDFEFLPSAVGEDLDLGSEASLVVSQAPKVNSQRMVLVATLVVQKNWIAT